MSLVVIPTSFAKHLGQALSDSGAYEVLWPEDNKEGARFFPDGEVYAKLPVSSPDDRTVVLHAGMPNPNDGLQELESILTLLKARKTKHIDVFFSYFPYSMQDGVFLEGELNAAEALVQKLIGYYGVAQLFVIDPHFGGRPWMEQYPIVPLSAMDSLKKEIEQKYPDALFLAPDAGGQRRFGLAGFVKDRIDSFSVTITNGEEIGKDLKGKTVVIVDDLVETGGTLVRIAESCREYGATKLIALITHAVLLKGVERVNEAYDEVFLANTIGHHDAQHDVVDLIRNTLTT